MGRPNKGIKNSRKSRILQETAEADESKKPRAETTNEKRITQEKMIPGMIPGGVEHDKSAAILADLLIKVVVREDHDVAGCGDGGHDEDGTQGQG